MAGSEPAPLRPLDDILNEAVHRDEKMEVYFTGARRISCVGTGGALGHPKVYYDIGDKGYAECMYCDRLFVYDPNRAGTVLEGGQEPRALNAPGESPRGASPAPDDDTAAR